MRKRKTLLYDFNSPPNKAGYYSISTDIDINPAVERGEIVYFGSLADEMMALGKVRGIIAIVERVRFLTIEEINELKGEETVLPSDLPN